MKPNLTRFNLAVLLMGAVSFSTLADEVSLPVHRCDELAAHPNDPNKAADGIPFPNINPEEALAECADAVEAFTAIPRFEYQLGRVYAKLKKYKQAIKWYRLSADQGYIFGYRGLAIRYERGEGIQQDLKKAFNLYHKVAEVGDVDSQSWLGWAYSEAKGVKKNLEKAIEWYRKAARQGDADAIFNLNIIYYGGQDAPEDKV